MQLSKQKKREILVFIILITMGLVFYLNYRNHKTFNKTFCFLAFAENQVTSQSLSFRGTRNHTLRSTKIGDSLCGASCVIPRSSE
jgi:hypothetical protein